MNPPKNTSVIPWTSIPASRAVTACAISCRNTDPKKISAANSAYPNAEAEVSSGNSLSSRDQNVATSSTAIQIHDEATLIGMPQIVAILNPRPNTLRGYPSPFEGLTECPCMLERASKPARGVRPDRRRRRLPQPRSG